MQRRICGGGEAWSCWRYYPSGTSTPGRLSHIILYGIVVNNWCITLPSALQNHVCQTSLRFPWICHMIVVVSPSPLCLVPMELSLPTALVGDLPTHGARRPLPPTALQTPRIRMLMARCHQHLQRMRKSLSLSTSLRRSSQEPVLLIAEHPTLWLSTPIKSSQNDDA